MTSAAVEAVERVSEANRGKRRLTEQEFREITSLLAAADDEEDWAILGVLGRRVLTDDERERVRELLSVQLMAQVLPDASLTVEGKAIDEIIGKLMDY
jgi:hypothetical protein